MSDYKCTCNSRDLFVNCGCRCTVHKPRTIAINITLPEVGFEAAWKIIKRAMYNLDQYKVARLDEPESIKDLVNIMIWIEIESPDTYDIIARELEQHMRFDKYYCATNRDDYEAY